MQPTRPRKDARSAVEPSRSPGPSFAEPVSREGRTEQGLTNAAHPDLEAVPAGSTHAYPHLGRHAAEDRTPRLKLDVEPDTAAGARQRGAESARYPGLDLKQTQPQPAGTLGKTLKALRLRFSGSGSEGLVVRPEPSAPSPQHRIREILERDRALIAAHAEPILPPESQPKHLSARATAFGAAGSGAGPMLPRPPVADSSDLGASSWDDLTPTAPGLVPSPPSARLEASHGSHGFLWDVESWQSADAGPAPSSAPSPPSERPRARSAGLPASRPPSRPPSLAPGPGGTSQVPPPMSASVAPPRAVGPSSRVPPPMGAALTSSVPPSEGRVAPPPARPTATPSVPAAAPPRVPVQSSQSLQPSPAVTTTEALAASAQALAAFGAAGLRNMAASSSRPPPAYEDDGPDDEPAPIRTRTMARLLVAQGKPQLALGIYRELVAQAPTDDGLRAEMERIVSAVDPGLR